MPAVSLAERRHLLRLDQAGLRRLQLAQRRLGGVARRADRFLGALALGDVGVDQHEAAAGHRVAAHLDDPAVGPRALEAHLPSGIFDGAAQLRFEIGRVLAAVGEIAEILGIARPPREEGVRQIEDLLEIAVPRGKARFGVEHGDAVAHIVEGDAHSAWRSRNSSNSRAFSIAITAWAAKVVASSISLSVKGFDARPGNAEYADQRVLA